MNLPVRIVYPVPLETREHRDLFLPFVTRFADSLRKFDPGCEYSLAVIENGGDEDCVKDCRAQFHGLPATYHRYEGAGCDIGSFQHYAHNIANENVFMVCCVTRVYAWKERWLEKLVDARKYIGNGLYGTCASREGGKLHVCTRCYAMDSEDFRRYSHQIISRDQGVFFELGDGNIYEWFKNQKLPTDVVCQRFISSAIDTSEAHLLTAPNIYRRGDQSELLVFDKHSDAYRDADPAEKLRLESLCFLGHE